MIPTKIDSLAMEETILPFLSLVCKIFFLLLLKNGLLEREKNQKRDCLKKIYYLTYWFICFEWFKSKRGRVVELDMMRVKEDKDLRNSSVMRSKKWKVQHC